MTYGQPFALSPQPLPADRVYLRLKLIDEETEELEEALLKGDAVEAYDAALDILYVTFGLLVEMGMDAQAGFDEVHRSNMSKLGEDGLPIKSRGMELDGFPEGKVLKGPNYFKPDLRRVLTELGLPE
jgi:phosphoribosyl-ATP pyrophosphohydrolase